MNINLTFKIASFTVLFLVNIFPVLGQEELSPLKYNASLFSNVQEKVGAAHNQFVYSIDTLDLPIIDDFSTDKFLKYNASQNDANISDTTWYRLNIGSIAEPMGTSYMIDTTFTYNYDTVPGRGFDSIILVSKVAFTSTFVNVSDIDNYHIVTTNTEVWPAHNYYDSLWTGTSPDIILIEQTPDLYQDSSTVYFVAPTSEDSSLIWIDNFVYRNNTFPINPLSIGVATFDGLNDNGYPYDWSSPSAYGIADYLTSKPINLSTKPGGGNYSDADSIYFSFAYQTTGIGEEPEAEDSLVLEFWSPAFNQWESAWNKQGGAQSGFQVVMIPITASRYLQDGFKFRFKNYGTLTGSLDHWHIDYVILDDFRTINDNKMNDWAFQFPAPSLIKNYTAMPWPHYETDPYGLLKTSIAVKTYNSLSQSKIIQPSGLDLLFNSTIVDNISYVNSAGNVNATSSFEMNYDIPTTFFFDTILADTCAIFDVRYTLSTNTTPERLTVNDTIVVQQKFQNYYSYDDGTAEAAYGLVTNGAELAYKFSLPNGISDTLRAVKMHFVSSVNDVSSSLFFLQVWDDNNGQPGNIIYTTDDVNVPVSYTPHYDLGNNAFYEYVLPEKLIVSGTYYVGWKQSSSDRLNIGFDKNIDNKSKIFYNVGSNWNNTSFEGSLMIRPVFSSEKDYLVGIAEEKNTLLKSTLYPNPAKDNFSIQFEKDLEATVILYDLSGRQLIEKSFYSNEVNLNIPNLSNGNYICIVRSTDGNIVFQSKVIVFK